MDAKNYENMFGNRYLSGIIGIDVEGIVLNQTKVIGGGRG